LRLERILFSIRPRRATGPESGRWQADLMREVRSIGPPGGEAPVLERFGALAWRFSLAGAVGVALLAIYTLRSGFVPYQELAVAMMDDPMSTFLSGLM
jgi:hypothetical protein